MTFVELNLSNNNKEDINKQQGQLKMSQSIVHSTTNGGKSDHQQNGRLKQAHKSPPRLYVNLSNGLHGVKENYFVQALSQTTLSFCEETTLHGMKYVVQDIQELGSTYSKYRKNNKK